MKKATLKWLSACLSVMAATEKDERLTAENARIN